MCGIAGVFNPVFPSDREIFPRMLDTLVPRGPDEEGTYADGRAILGSRRLSIVDVEGGTQPISSEDDSLWVVLNGEIYNHVELRESLQKKGHRFKTRSDTEVLVHLYEEEGLDFVRRLRGMFAFALYDRSSQELIMARDRVGKKPLFYAQIGKRVLFASEIKALLVHPDLPREPNFESLYHYLTLKHIPRPATAFQGISSLLPAEMAVFDAEGNCRKSIYWSVSFHPREVPEEEAVKGLEKRLREAVRLRVYSSDVPVGAFLSGGLDSSLVVALMREYAGGELHTFSLAYGEEENPDTPYARQMSDLLRTTHHEEVLDTKKIPAALPGIVTSFDEPFGGVISTYFLSGLISRHVKVALSGDGADELFGSYANHRLAWPIHHCLRGTPGWESWTGEADRVRGLAHENPAVWRMRLYTFDDAMKRRLLGRSFLSRLNGASTLDLLERWFKKADASDPLNQVLEVDFHTLLPDEVLTYVDRLSMAHSLEVRSPFLDQEVVSYAAALPGTYKINRRETKYILRKLASQYLPREIVERPKKGFVLPFHRWLLGSLRAHTLEALSPQKLGRTGLLNAGAVRDLLAAQEGGQDRTYGLFSMLMFQLWWEKFF